MMIIDYKNNISRLRLQMADSTDEIRSQFVKIERIFNESKSELSEWDNDLIDDFNKSKGDLILFCNTLDNISYRLNELENKLRCLENRKFDF